jgi:hypothetical protein
MQGAPGISLKHPVVETDPPAEENRREVVKPGPHSKFRRRLIESADLCVVSGLNRSSNREMRR